ncbi:MAG TPA: hypothetical protein VGG29_10120 [Caulobacteraceae bacterium]|jgi:hypothetical protein
MAAFWDAHPWLIIILAIFAIPLVQALLDPWRRFLLYRERRDAIEALKIYAAQGREPPADVLAALGGRKWARRALRAAAGRGPGAGPGIDIDFGGDGVDRLDRWIDLHRSREPFRRWNGAIFAWAIAGGFAYASQHVHQYADTYLVIAAIAGALAVAATLTALMATFWRGRG